MGDCLRGLVCCTYLSSKGQGELGMIEKRRDLPPWELSRHFFFKSKNMMSDPVCTSVFAHVCYLWRPQKLRV